MRTLRRKRTWQIASLAFGCVFVYVLSLLLLKRDAYVREETFKSASTGSAAVRLYVDERTLDPIRQSLDVRIDLVSNSTQPGARYGGPFDREIELSIGDGDSEQVIDIHRNDRDVGHVVSLDVRGALAAYPFDRYHGEMVITARERSVRGQLRPVPVVALLWGGIPGWVTSIHASPAAQPKLALAMTLSLRRTLPVMSFAFIFFGLMVVVSICSLCIGGFVFVGARRVESTIVGALAAMVFSVVALRNALPGTPPIGVTADLAIFLWAEISVIVGLSLLVAAWVRRGPGA